MEVLKILEKKENLNWDYDRETGIKKRSSAATGKLR